MPGICSGSKEAVRRIGIERCQSRIEAESRSAVGTEDRVRLAHDIPVLDADDGGWVLHARTQFNPLRGVDSLSGHLRTKTIASYTTASSSRLPEGQTWASTNK